LNVAADLHGELLNQARHLAVKEPRRPRQASLRRAVSTSYYALFHLLTRETTRLLVGTAVIDDNLRSMLGRAFTHREMADASKAFRNGADGLPPSYRRLPGASEVPGELQLVARSFSELQELRNRADYDLESTFAREDVLRVTDKTERAFEAWQGIRKEPAARLYLLALLMWSRLPRT
jgi:hypothetical protein